MADIDVRKILRELMRKTGTSLSVFCENVKTEALSSVKLAKRKTRKNWRKFYKNLKTVTPLSSVRAIRRYPFASLCVVAGSGALYLLFQSFQKRQARILTTIKRRSTERVFLKFASVEYDGQVYMTPSDFLDSVMEVNPRIRRNRKLVLSDQYLEHIKRKTPSVGSSRFFTKLQDNGIISYTDYLFLLSILIKQQSSFEIAFKMLDRNDSNGIDKDEYLVLERVFSRDWKLRRGFYIEDAPLPPLDEEELVDDEAGLQRKHDVDTTLVIHFFGKDGTNILTYKTFKKFVTDLQREVLELEFNQFSHGLPVITELDFAKLLIRYTHMDAEYDYDNYIERLLSRTEKHNPQEGITFEEFKAFVGFLNNVEEFFFAIRYYTQINPNVSRIDFHDAFRMLSNHNLKFHLIDTVFNIFDVDGDGVINYQDFILVINDRLHRGFKPHLKRTGWNAFKRCVKQTTNRNPAVMFYRRKSKIQG